MQHFLRLFLLTLTTVSLFAQTTGTPADKSIDATVTGSGLNVRALANTRSEVLCQLRKDQQITVFEIKNEWARIQAPKDAVIWIQAENIKDNKAVKDAPLYAGPAILYSQVSKVKAGQIIEVIRGSEKWKQIVPPKGISAWISAEYIKFPEIKVKETGDTENIKKPVEKKKDEEVIASLDPGDKQYYFDKKLATEKGLQLVTGTVSKLKKPIENLATHALIITVNRQYHTLCYLRSSNYKLNEWLNKEVAVQGKQELIAGWKRPVIDVTNIRPIIGKPQLKMKESNE